MKTFIVMYRTKDRIKMWFDVIASDKEQAYDVAKRYIPKDSEITSVYENNNISLTEDKTQITQDLHRVLMSTRAGADIIDMYYSKLPDHTETVTIRYVNGYKKVINVTMDSGAALIRDVMKELN